jgi:hypothetical protein
MHALSIIVALTAAFALGSCSDRPKAEKGEAGEEGEPGPQDLPVLLDRRAWSFVSAMESVARPARLRARQTNVSSILTPSI